MYSVFVVLQLRAIADGDLKLDSIMNESFQLLTLELRIFILLLHFFHQLKHPKLSCQGCLIALMLCSLVKFIQKEAMKNINNRWSDEFLSATFNYIAMLHFMRQNESTIISIFFVCFLIFLSYFHQFCDALAPVMTILTHLLIDHGMPSQIYQDYPLSFSHYLIAYSYWLVAISFTKTIENVKTIIHFQRAVFQISKKLSSWQIQS